MINQRVHYFDLCLSYFYNIKSMPWIIADWRWRHHYGGDVIIVTTHDKCFYLHIENKLAVIFPFPSLIIPFHNCMLPIVLLCCCGLLFMQIFQYTFLSLVFHGRKDFDHIENDSICSKAIRLTGKYFIKLTSPTTFTCTKDWDFYNLLL